MQTQNIQNRLKRIETTFTDSLYRDCKIAADRYLVAVSGGPDSVALLRLLLKVKDRFQLTLVVAHIEHCMRKDGPDDSLFCCELAARYDLPFETMAVDVVTHSKTQKISLETAARELRYDALERIMIRQQCKGLLLGHTADEQAETVLFNLSRGSGVRGLAGIPALYMKRHRPLLKIRKADILFYLEMHEQKYCTDTTNRDTTFKRNRIRHKILPYLDKHLQAKMTNTLCRLAASMSEIEEMLVNQSLMALPDVVKEESGGKIVLDINRFSTYFIPIRKYIIRSCIEKLSGRSVRPDFAALGRALAAIETAKIGNKTTLHKNWKLVIDHDGIVIWNGLQDQFDTKCSAGECVWVTQQFFFQSQLIHSPQNDLFKKSDKNNQFIDADKSGSAFHIRTYRKGDFFYPLGMKNKKSLSNFFTDLKIPLHKRQEIPLVLYKDAIIWVVGYRLDDRFKITNKTKRLFHLEMRELNS